MTDLKIDLDLSPALNALNDLKRSQIPFATALALTRTSQYAQREVKRSLPERFTIRNTFVERGVKVKAATKASQEATVHWQAPVASRRGFAQSLARQETGGGKTPAKKWLAIPQKGVKRTGGGMIPKRMQPAAALRNKRTFVAPNQSGGQTIYRRTTKQRYPIVALYTLTERVNVRGAFEFVPTAREASRKVFKREFGKAFAKAIASRRP